MEGFNSQQGASDRDVKVDKGEVIAAEAAAVEVIAAEAASVEDMVDTYIIRMCHEAFPSTSN